MRRPFIPYSREPLSISLPTLVDFRAPDNRVAPWDKKTEAAKVVEEGQTNFDKIARLRDRA